MTKTTALVLFVLGMFFVVQAGMLATVPVLLYLFRNAIIEAGYKVIHLDLHGMSIDAERQ